MIKANNIRCPRILVYAQSVPVCSGMFTFLARQIARNRMVAMYHAGTDPKIEKFVLGSLGKSDGIVGAVLATSALGMGVDFKELHLVLHYGPPSDVESYVQQLGRAGRDGVQSYGVLIYNGRQLQLCEPEMMGYLKTDQCCRNILVGSFNESKDSDYVTGHLCCDNCAPKCKCASESCEWLKPIPETGMSIENHDVARLRDMSAEDRESFSTVERMSVTVQNRNSGIRSIHVLFKN